MSSPATDHRARPWTSVGAVAELPRPGGATVQHDVEPHQREAALAEGRRLAGGEDRRQPDQRAAPRLEGRLQRRGRPRPRRRTAARPGRPRWSGHRRPGRPARPRATRCHRVAAAARCGGTPPAGRTSPHPRRPLRRPAPGPDTSAAAPSGTPGRWRHRCGRRPMPVKLSAGSSRPPLPDVLGVLRVGDDVAVGALARLGAVGGGGATSGTSVTARITREASASSDDHRRVGRRCTAGDPPGHAPESRARGGPRSVIHRQRTHVEQCRHAVASSCSPTVAEELRAALRRGGRPRAGAGSSSPEWTT